MADKRLGRIYPESAVNPTVQSAKEECDINTIVARAKAGADVSGLVKDRQAIYGDFTQFPHLYESMCMVTKANEMFMQLDPYLRKRFDNDPAKLVAFCEDNKNYDEAVKLGLVIPRVKADKADSTKDSSESESKPSTKGKAV